MRNNFVFYTCIWCKLEEVRDCIKKSSNLLKDMIDYIKDYGDEDGVTFLELTEESLKNLPVLMVDNMKCFNQNNIDTMVFYIKHLQLKEENVEKVKEYFVRLMKSLLPFGFNGELLLIKEIKVEEENAGKTVGKRNYNILYNEEYK